MKLFFCLMLMFAWGGWAAGGADLGGVLTAEVLQSGSVRLAPGVYTTGDFTIPAGFKLEFAPGARIEVAPGATLTFNGRIDAGMQPIFGGEGKVAGAPEVPAVYPEWFGAVGDGQADDTRALQQAANLAQHARGKLLSIGPGRYRYQDEIIVRCNIDCQGVLVNELEIDESKTQDRFRNYLLFYYPKRNPRIIIEPDEAPIPLDEKSFYGIRRNSFKVPAFNRVPRRDRAGEFVDLVEGGTLRMVSTDFFTTRLNNRNDEYYNKEDICFLTSPAGDVFPEFNFDYLNFQDSEAWQAGRRYRAGDYVKSGQDTYKATLASGPGVQYVHPRYGTAEMGDCPPASGLRKNIVYTNGKKDTVNVWVKMAFTVEYLPPQPPLFIRGLQVEVSRADRDPRRRSVHTQVVLCRRSNVTFDRLHLKNVDRRLFLYNLLSLTNCVRTELNNCSFSGALFHSLGYNVMEHNVACTTFNSCVSVHSRDGLAARHGKNITINGGHFNRVDDHYGKNYVIRDAVFHCQSTVLPGHRTPACDLEKQQLAPSHGIVFAGENIIVENCTFYNPRIVLCNRMDVGDFGGKIVLRNITVVSDSDPLLVNHEIAPDFDYAHTPLRPQSVLIDNATINTPHTLKFNLKGVDANLYTVRDSTATPLPGMKIK